MPEVLSRVLYPLDPALEEVGTSLDDLLLEHHLSPREIRKSPGGRIPWNTFADVLESAGDRLGGPAALENVGADHLLWSWQALIAIISRYVEPYYAFQFGVKWFGPMMFKGIRAELEKTPGGLVETVFIPPDRRDSPEFFSLCLGVMRRAPMLMGWEVSHLEFEHSERRGHYRIQFQRPATTTPEPVANTSRRGADYDQDIEELSILHVDSDFTIAPDSAHSGSNGTMVDRIRAALREGDLAIALTAEDVARHLGMSERSLARRLASEGNSFRAVRDEVRCEIAIERIRAEVPISEVAYLLGFADPASFHRAFRRWTGRSPGEYKRASLPFAAGGKSQDSGWIGQSREMRAPVIPNG